MKANRSGILQIAVDVKGDIIDVLFNGETLRIRLRTSTQTALETELISSSGLQHRACSVEASKSISTPTEEHVQEQKRRRHDSPEFQGELNRLFPPHQWWFKLNPGIHKSQIVTGELYEFRDVHAWDRASPNDDEDRYFPTRPGLAVFDGLHRGVVQGWSGDVPYLVPSSSKGGNPMSIELEKQENMLSLIDENDDRLPEPWPNRLQFADTHGYPVQHVLHPRLLDPCLVKGASHDAKDCWPSERKRHAESQALRGKNNVHLRVSSSLGGHFRPKPIHNNGSS